MDADDLREAVAAIIDPNAFNGLLPSPARGDYQTLARVMADAIIALVVEQCAAEADAFDGPPSDSDFCNGQATAAQQIRWRILALAQQEPGDG